MKLFKWRTIKSIRTTFMIPFVIPLLIIIIVPSVFMRRGANDISMFAVETISDQVFNRMISLLDDQLEQAMQLNQVNALNYERGLLHLDVSGNRDQYFSGMISAYNDVAMTFVGLDDGSFYGARRSIDGSIQVVRNDAQTGGASEYYLVDEQGNRQEFVERFDNFDPRKRPWYVKATEEKAPVLSDVYNHFVVKLPTITASYPVLENGEVIAVFGVDYLLTWIGETLSSVSDDQTGMVYITDDDGNLIASSRASDEIFEMVSGESKLVSANESANALIRQSADVTFGDGIKELEINKNTYYSKAVKYQNFGLDWELTILLSKEIILSDMQVALNRINNTMGISFILFIILAYLMTRWITKPILKLNAASLRLAEGKFEFVSDEIRQDELGQLSRSFNEMAIKLTNVVSGLENQVEERTKALQEMNESLSRLSYSDGLTGLPNRRKFNDFYESAYQANALKERHMVLLMMDLDNFKSFNDTYGHLAGDDCLRLVSQVMLNMFPHKKDLVARYGGEEFSAVLQGYSKDEALAICEQLRKRINEIDIVVDGVIIKVTISIGMVYFVPTDISMMDEWIKSADFALYQAKHHGKNQTWISV
ncbi:MAG: diguanylate cyclase [Firmicutes bacterium]|nr:diguanylate cyclase [Bacillota bacterium]